MHYKNGKPVSVGDKIVIPDPQGNFTAIVVQTTGGDACNLYVLPLPLQNYRVAHSKECLLIEDAINL